MVLDQELSNLLTGLFNRSFVNQVNWQRGQDIFASGESIGSEYLIRFPSSVLSIAHIQPPDQQEYIVFQMCNANGHPLTTERVLPDDPYWDLLSRLYESASHSPSLWRPLVAEIKEALGGSSRVGLDPDLAAVEATKDFFLKIAGKWHLKWNNGEEDARIDEFGHYYLIRPNDELDYFTLEKVLFDPTTNHVSFDKISTGQQAVVGPKGKFHSREVLDISTDMQTMHGYDEPHRYTLKYTKTKA